MTTERAIEIVKAISEQVADECDCCMGDHTCMHHAPGLVMRIIKALKDNAKS
jgi:hypothetical protein